ncbi:hypothetical protein [Sulfolobus acidocaldarius]|uniref:Conserved Archaeal protein n=4 Tax=Sulfolobus acidocaldarius TaxID=2285 RepID=Q4J8G4_SULAC|nr:hypothetical protein [Sulfolobus acidocaldarius]AAY80912.1 conserved Archaeal protein [Sulfolobus acidocaldarius DSM 639]AGE71512.1 hypothetical protein SacN8_07760 [Sulfolobus acidocaldarius N8]AGE73785.1 hypothetical protein SacRon12I_07770 [Sulfolobus acidocaldarius Ron12/I]ALU30256.1 hypothetical protein ATY89_10110 [Sulfolobus acidocaldarius]ALU30972.1 hypothetical protein ATZ20_01665 [Sulfolobus acidocaldarius]
MSVKFGKHDKNQLSEELARISEMIDKAEEIHEETGEVPTTDLVNLYTLSGYYESKVGKGNYTYYHLYSVFAEKYVNFIRTTMSEYARSTKETEIEYINILLDDGYFLILEGEEDKVVLPHPSALASTHTHPGICFFSHKDLETADFLFMRNYLAVGVTSNECALILFRNGVYTLEDKSELESLSKQVKKVKTFQELLNVYSNSSKKFTNLKLLFTQFA